MIKFSVDIEPMGAVRTTTGMIKRIKYRLYEPGDKKVERVLRYLTYKETLAWEARKHFKGEPLTGPLDLRLTFYLPMPESWSQKKKDRMVGERHANKPDRDNLEKGVSDSFNKIIWKDDGQICDGPVRKFWGLEPKIEIEISEMS